MSSPSTSKLAQCPACGAKIEGNPARCWLCGSALSGASEQAATATGADLALVAKPPSDAIRPSGFSCQSLMLVVTLAAIVLGIVSISPGLGILISILALPALIRTGILIRRQETGDRSSVRLKATLFAASLAVVTIAGVAASITFGIVCTTGGFISFTMAYSPSGSETWGIVVSFLLGGAAGLYVFYRVMKLFSTG